MILGSNYIDYEDALTKCNLEKLSLRRKSKCLKFGLKSLLHPAHKDLFPVNPHILTNNYNSKKTEHFKVNWSRTESYRMSTVPHIQRMLNDYVKQQRIQQQSTNQS